METPNKQITEFVEAHEKLFIEDMQIPPVDAFIESVQPVLRNHRRRIKRIQKWKIITACLFVMIMIAGIYVIEYSPSARAALSVAYQYITRNEGKETSNYILTSNKVVYVETVQTELGSKNIIYQCGDKRIVIILLSNNLTPLITTNNIYKYEQIFVDGINKYVTMLSESDSCAAFFEENQYVVSITADIADVELFKEILLSLERSN